ncbi:MAG: hypothetical protein ACXV4C_10545 [Halobacteriota archaeon]
MAERAGEPRPLIALAIISLCTLGALTTIPFLSPPVQDGLAWRQPLTGSLFALLCILGMIAVFFPQRCARRSSVYPNSHHKASLHRQDSLQATSSIAGITVTHGHHPRCERYRQHEFRLGEKTLCSACLGLFTGALISLAAACYIFLLQRPFDPPYGLASVVGALGVMIGVVSYVVTKTQGPAGRFFINAFMIVGMLLALIGADRSSQSLALNVLLISTCMLALFTRILLSQDRHDQICRTCEQSCVS